MKNAHYMLHYPTFNNHNKIKDTYILLYTSHYSICLRIFKKRKLTQRLISNLFKVTVISNAAQIQIKSLL